MMNPLSLKIGMEMIQPISSNAISGCFFPQNLTVHSASFIAAPVLSMMIPMIEPNITSSPMELNMEPKPRSMVVGIARRGIPATKARIREMPMMAMNGGTLNLDIETIITAMAMTSATNSQRPDIYAPHSH